MKLLQASVAAILGVSAQDTTRSRNKFGSTPYALDLNCGDCIASGFNFIWKSEETGLIVSDEEYPSNTGNFADTDTFCCQGDVDYFTTLKNDNAWNPTNTPDTPDGKCTQILALLRGKEKTLWRQSDSFASNSYAMSFCPFRKSSCGPNNLINFYTSADDGAIHVIGLKQGESCTYNIESVCGAPSFRIENSTDVEIIFNEWQQDSVSTVLPVTNAPVGSSDIKRASPSADLPARNVEFILDGENTEGGPIYGTYNKGGFWKSWNNNQ